MRKEISAVWIIILSKKLGGWGFQRAWDSSKFGVFEDQQGEKRVCRRVRGSMVGKEVDRIQGPNQVTPWGLQQELWLDPKYDEKPLEDVSRGVMSFGFLFFFFKCVLSAIRGTDCRGRNGSWTAAGGDSSSPGRDDDGWDSVGDNKAGKM